jgi:hypothetical protein
MAAFGIEKGHRGIEATERFPWLEDIDPKSPNESEFYKSFRWTISKWYFGVSRGEMTFDELIDKVRAIEPPESTTETTIEDIPMVEAAK